MHIVNFASLPRVSHTIHMATHPTLFTMIILDVRSYDPRDDSGHNIEVTATIKTLQIIMRVHTIDQPTIINITCRHYKTQYFYWIENIMHLKVVQPRGRKWICHRDGERRLLHMSIPLTIHPTQIKTQSPIIGWWPIYIKWLGLG